MSDRRPVIGVTADVVDGEPGKRGGRAVCAMAYCRAVAMAGGTPVVLPPVVGLAEAHLALCDGFVLTGGDDPRTEPFGEPTHPAATPVHPERQAYETALLGALRGEPGMPVLGVCLGMQMMALVAGGSLHQHLPDVVATWEDHAGDRRHVVRPVLGGTVVGGGGEVTSRHHQGVRSAGALRVVGVAEDGVLEAIDDPSRGYYVGVQWHPERTDDTNLGTRLFEGLVGAARGRERGA